MKKSFLAALVKEGAQFGQVAVQAHARGRASQQASQVRKKTADCTPCAAKKTAAKMWNSMWK